MEKSPLSVWFCDGFSSWEPAERLQCGVCARGGFLRVMYRLVHYRVNIMQVAVCSCWSFEKTLKVFLRALNDSFKASHRKASVTRGLFSSAHVRRVNQDVFIPSLQPQGTLSLSNLSCWLTMNIYFSGIFQFILQSRWRAEKKHFSPFQQS